MIGQDPREAWRNIAGALDVTGLRAVVSAGWGGLDAVDVPDDVMFVRDVPHAWLLPRTAVTVHHGGAGTTGAAFAAGRPQVVSPFFRDQPFWAERAQRLGVAPPAVRQRRLGVRALADALTAAVSSDTMAARAEHLGRLVRAENGTATAVAALEEVHSGFAARR